MTTTDPDMHRPYLALLLAILDNDDHRAHAIITTCGAPAELAHYAARKMVTSIDPADHDEMRADIAAELERHGNGR